MASNGTDTAGKNSWRTPLGVMEVLGDSSVVARLHHGVDNSNVITAGLAALIEVNDAGLLPVTSVDAREDGLTLHWAPKGTTFTPLPHIVSVWRRSPATCLPGVMALVEMLGRCARGLDRMRPARFLYSPVQVFQCREEDGSERWGIVPIPLGEATLEDFSASSDESLAWVSADQILGSRDHDWCFLQGAALYYCLVGDLYPSDLPRSDVMRRLILHRSGNLARARSVLSADLPKTMAAQAVAFTDFIFTLLGPTHGRKLSPVQARQIFDNFQADFAAPALADAWECERNLYNAVGVLNEFARWAAPSAVPWQKLARLRELTGDPSGAAIIDPPRAARHVDNVPETLIAKLRSIAALGELGRPDLEEAVKQLSQTGPEGLSDEDFLYLVYVNGRWLRRTAESLRLLDRSFHVSWYQVVRSILQARLQAAENLWIRAAGSCRESRRLIETLPNKGGNDGRYARAYADTLDGIAHLMAVRGGLSPAYLIDAMALLQSAWIALGEIAPGELDNVLAAWLRELARTLAQHPELSLQYLTAEAFCQSLPVTTSETVVPWFYEQRLFSH